MDKKTIIAVDAMGGENSPDKILNGISLFLKDNKNVAWVSHPDLPDHPDNKLASKILPKGAGSIIVFGVKGGLEAGSTFINSVKLASHLANVGDAKTLVIHPASTTHAQMDEVTMKQAGLTMDMIRLSVGLEDVNDLIGDFKQALSKAAKVSGQKTPSGRKK